MITVTGTYEVINEPNERIANGIRLASEAAQKVIDEYFTEEERQELLDIEVVLNICCYQISMFMFKELIRYTKQDRTAGLLDTLLTNFMRNLRNSVRETVTRNLPNLPDSNAE